MFLSDFSIRRPVAMTAGILVLLLAGVNSYRRIGLNNMPDIDIPYITVTTVYPGASPGEIEVDVARKIEDAVSNIDGLKHVDSVCMENLCMSLLEFELEVDVDVAATDVRERIDLILNDLPADVESPKILKFDPNSKPIVTLLLVGDLPIDTLFDYADEELSDRLSTIRGVAEVQVTGGEKLEVHVVLDKEKLAAHDLNAADVLQKLASSNVKMPSGTLREGIQEVSVTYDAEFRDFEAMRALEIGNSQGARIYLRDIAEIEMVSKEPRTRAYYNGQPAVNMKVVKKGEANAVEVADRVRKVVDRIRSTNMLPSGMELVWFTDDASFIRASVDDAWSSVFLGILLTAAVLFLFLLEWRSTLVVAVSMPVSIVITFIVMRRFDYTFNNSTLLSLGTSVGVLVTNSIVVIENIVRKLHDGALPGDAARTGSSEVALPVFASATTNVVVFVPIALMTTIVGRYFIPFAVTMTAATLVSLFISFSLTPILSAILLRNREEHAVHSGLFRRFASFWQGIYERLENGYDSSLRFAARYPKSLLTLIAIVFVLAFLYIVPKVGVSFFPDSDRGEFIVKIEYPPYLNINETTRRALVISERLSKMPEVLSVSTLIGKVQGVIGQTSEGVYLAEVTIKTTGKRERPEMDMDRMRAAIRNELRNETDCLISVNVPSMVGGADTEIEMEIAGDDLAILDALALHAVDFSKRSGIMVDVDSNVRIRKPEIRISPRRPQLEDIGIPAKLLGMILRGNIEGLKVGTFKRQDRSFDIRVKLRDREGFDQIHEYTFMSKQGRPLSIGTVCDVRFDGIPVQITRSDKRRIVKFFANCAPDVALGDAVKALGAEMRSRLPQGYEANFTGKVEVMGDAQRDFLEAIVLASLLTYLLIAAILESWIQPFIILLTLPLALVGMFTALYLAGLSLSMMGLLGAVMLIGIVVNNAILIMDQVVIHRARAVSPSESMLRAAKEKFRPILMTSLAAILGMLPMAFGKGLGSEIRESCGMAVIGGLISSTLLSVYLIPVVYVLFMQDRKKTACADNLKT